MTQASKEAYVKPENIKARKTHKQRVYGVMFLPRTIREAKSATGLSYNQCQKRIFDLKSEGKLIECGEKMERGNMNTIFKRPDENKLVEKKPTFKSWCKENHPEVWHEYDILYNGNL